MKVVFTGPTLAGSDPALARAVIDVRGPAGLGDVLAAVLGGATVIGLIDGVYGDRPAIWHKEILHALAAGVTVVGAASMGALRAAECEPFGMIGVGGVFEQFRNGERVDDGDVAVSHGPAELGWMRLSEPLTNVEATVAALAEEALVAPETASALVAAARRLPFETRTLDAVARTATTGDPASAARISALLSAHYRDVKRSDALALVRLVAETPDRRVTPPSGWRFRSTLPFDDLLAAVSARLGQRDGRSGA